MELGYRIRTLRKQANMTQAQLAEALSISVQSVSKWENGQTSPDIGILPKLSSLLSTSIDYLLTGKENIRYITISPYELCQTDRQIVKQAKPPEPRISYNGIKPEKVFPPRNLQKIRGYDRLPVPYLKNPPHIIDISVGRQLFVDDFLIEKTTFIRQYHKLRRYTGNPVFVPETPMERGLDGHVAMAGPFSDGVWYDGREMKYKMWYQAGWFDGTAYAESADGISWKRIPCCVDGTNRVIPVREGVSRDSGAVVLNRYYEEEAPYKMFLYVRPGGGEIWDSADGMKWRRISGTGEIGDRSTFFYNPFRKKWVYSMRTEFGPYAPVRARSYVEADTLEEGAPLENPAYWVRTDRYDPINQTIGDVPCLYNLDAVAFESVMLGVFSVFVGPENNVSTISGIPKDTEFQFAWSRDGFHWSRPDDRTPVLASEREKEDSWERGYLNSNNGVCIVDGDELRFYYSAFRGDTTVTCQPTAQDGMYANASTGFAVLRRDGFSSMNAAGFTAFLMTRPLRFEGSCLFVNADFHKGGLRIAVYDEANQPIAGYEAENCIQMKEDSTKYRITWQEKDTLNELAGTVIRIRFEGTNGALYAFWIADDENGHSRGYLGAGAVGYPDIRDFSMTPKERGTLFLSRMIRITNAQICGAYDSQMVIIRGRAYIVYEANDVQPGESPYWPFVYSALSVVDIVSMKLLSTHEIAAPSRIFKNNRLKAGACFTPRILIKDEHTLRIFFVSIDPEVRESESWYRDYDLDRESFDDKIFPLFLKTEAERIPFSPSVFHRIAEVNGFHKPLTQDGPYLFDVDKEIKGKRYAVVNLFFGKLTALAEFNDFLDTLTLHSFITNPDADDLSEAAVERMPDGRWIAILRCDNSNQNYRFTFSKDGINWSSAKELKTVQNGSNSKPFLYHYGKVYCMGWQEKPLRSRFNIDVSFDCEHWIRMFSINNMDFSLQYPSLYLWQDQIYVCATHCSPSEADDRRDSIYFGRLCSLTEMEKYVEQNS